MAPLAFILMLFPLAVIGEAICTADSGSSDKCTQRASTDSSVLLQSNVGVQHVELGKPAVAHPQPRGEDRPECAAVLMSMALYGPLGESQSLGGFDVKKIFAAKAKAAWTCQEKVMSTGGLTFGVVEGGGYEAWNHCSNFGFADLASCQERCGNIDNCAYMNYDPAQGSCGKSGYCYLNDNTHTSTTGWGDTGTMCAKPRGPGDVDKAAWYQKGDACWLAFIGWNHDSDLANIFNPTAITKWGISGVHSGIAAELEPLVNLMDFAQIRSSCTGPLTVTGHSMGGGLAQLFTLAINKEGDPLSANLKVDFLYTFGAMSATIGNGVNDKNKAGGCFAGAQYYYAERDPDYVVDNYDPSTTHEPIKSSKMYVFNDGSNETFPCGTPLPQSQSLLKAKGMKAWAPLHTSYKSHLRC